MNKDIWYFAYGSNLSVDQKKDRTGMIRKKLLCRLPGYRLAFNKKSRDGKVRANIIAAGSEEVWGIAYLCDETAMTHMDEWEGVRHGHYRRQKVEVISASEQKPLDAITYVACEESICPEGEPNSEYLALILEGARENHLPSHYIGQIALLACRNKRSG